MIVGTGGGGNVTRVADGQFMLCVGRGIGRLWENLDRISRPQTCRAGISRIKRSGDFFKGYHTENQDHIEDKATFLHDTITLRLPVQVRMQAKLQRAQYNYIVHIDVHSNAQCNEIKIFFTTKLQNFHTILSTNADHAHVMRDRIDIETNFFIVKNFNKMRPFN